MSEYNPLINQVILLVISIGLTLLLRWLFDDVLKALVDQYRVRVNESVRYEIDELVSTAVHAAEQLGITGELEKMGKDKLDYALDFLAAEFERRGIDLDMTAIRALVEAEVKRALNTPRGQG